ncbi:phosphoglycerate dehydrogenase [Microbacteriaceae bacterium VKM Ac-2855]|nr:phosphoglycerate dehydrogenase [Microbacteriaceae bacterium VKM Ac-2855]
MKVLVPNTIRLELPGVDAVDYDPTGPIPEEHLDAEVLIVWRSTSASVQDAAARMPALRLVQTLAAGPDQIQSAGFAPEVLLASGRSLHDETVTEHTLALVLAAIRRLDRMRDAQQQAHWAEEFNVAQRDPETEQQYTLAGARVAIWGFGSIASHLAPLLKTLGADVFGIASTAGERYGFPVVADIAEHLGDVDVLISLLPATEATEKAFDAALIARMKPGAIFVNVGRGATVDEDALLAALGDGRLRVAALDVMREEPLPADSPLWAAPNVILTPHAAGNRPRGASELVRRNLAALDEGGEITNRV